jgi:hypothetical protein
VLREALEDAVSADDHDVVDARLGVVADQEPQVEPQGGNPVDPDGSVDGTGKLLLEASREK